MICREYLLMRPLYSYRGFIFERMRNLSTIAEKRRKSREQAFIVLFEKSFNEDMSFSEIVNIAIESEVIVADDFMNDILAATANNLESIDSEIEKNLAITEIRFMDDIPVGVSINESVEICKIYGSDEDKSFINGVLGSVARSEEE